MKKIISALVMSVVMAFILSGCTGASAKNDSMATGTTSAGIGAAPDYTRKYCWYKIPEITQEVDTFYIYSTAYYESSFQKGAPDYAALDNPEMLAGAHFLR